MNIDKFKSKFWGNKKQKSYSAALLVLLICCTVLSFFRPPMQLLKQQIPQDFIENSGDKYSYFEYNFIVLNAVRGRNVKTAQAFTYIGIAGQVINADSGAAKKLSDILFWLPALFAGAKLTISLTMVSVTCGLLGSIFLALGKMSKKKFLNKLSGAYIFFFRGTPLLMQLFFIYYGLPAINPAWAINNKFLAAFIAFSLNSIAYCAEIIRAAIQSIAKGQFEVSRVLGLSYAQTMRLIIIPQSFRRLIPPVANEFIMVLKDASLVSIIALSDLTHVTRTISSSASSVLVYIPAMLIYLMITAFFTFVFNKLEKHFSIYE